MLHLHSSHPPLPVYTKKKPQEAAITLMKAPPRNAMRLRCSVCGGVARSVGLLQLWGARCPASGASGILRAAQSSQCSTSVRHSWNSCRPSVSIRPSSLRSTPPWSMISSIPSASQPDRSQACWNVIHSGAKSQSTGLAMRLVGASIFTPSAGGVASKCKARPAGLEPTTFGFVDRSSIQLRYGRNQSYHSMETDLVKFIASGWMVFSPSPPTA